MRKFIAGLEARMEREAALIEKAKNEEDRHNEVKRELQKELEAIGQEHPGFSNEDVGI